MSVIQQANLAKNPVKASVLKFGSLCRVNLPNFKENIALGFVTDIQIISIGKNPPYTVVWLDMVLDGASRPFEPENLDIVPRVNGQWDNEQIAQLLNEVAAVNHA